MAPQPRRLRKDEVERLLAAVEAAGDDVEAVRRAVADAVGLWLADASIEQLWDLAAALNERRTL